ncbi:hypothetical protein BD310DRAFT_207155 [Dichomitus squalens]|uniref:Integral membrane protein n=1 Tax=Dichomitus squalens TaxID=114155 RepID=A0A4Q9PH58_9APHY|nr:hypothetical protein BD310DRAFT_207155 [Dichomitus squalens]
MSSPVPPLPETPRISLDNSFGAVLIGTFVGLVLYGIILHQVYQYSRMYTLDKIELKLAVYATVILETVHIAFSCHTCYYYLVQGYFKPSVLAYPTHPLQFLPIVMSLIVCTAQGFFARRAYLFGRKYRIWVFIAVFCLVGELAFCIATTSFKPTGDFASWVPDTWILACASGFAMAADFILTTVLIIALRQSRTGVKRSDSSLDILVLYTITTDR